MTEDAFYRKYEKYIPEDLRDKFSDDLENIEEDERNYTDDWERGRPGHPDNDMGM